MAKAAAPYIHPRLSTHKVSGEIQLKNVDVSMFSDDELAMIAAGQATDEFITRLIAATQQATRNGRAGAEIVSANIKR